jgi:hypothetical protein
MVLSSMRADSAARRAGNLSVIVAPRGTRQSRRNCPYVAEDDGNAPSGRIWGSWVKTGEFRARPLFRSGATGVALIFLSDAGDDWDVSAESRAWCRFVEDLTTTH